MRRILANKKFTVELRLIEHDIFSEYVMIRVYDRPETVPITVEGGRPPATFDKHEVVVGKMCTDKEEERWARAFAAFGQSWLERIRKLQEMKEGESDG